MLVQKQTLNLLHFISICIIIDLPFCPLCPYKMDVDLQTTVNTSVMASSGSTGSISVLLHPLVFMFLTLKKLIFLFNLTLNSLKKVRYEHFGTLDTHTSPGRQSTARYQYSSLKLFKNHKIFIDVPSIFSYWSSNWKTERKKLGNHEFLWAHVHCHWWYCYWQRLLQHQRRTMY